MSIPVVRWGILGTATIARKIWQAIGRSGNGDIVAVASRDGRRATSFINDCQRHFWLPHAPRALTGYEALLDDESIDAVYVPLPTGIRKPWVIRAAQAGKHVLCEKPCALSAADLREMIEVCDEHGVQFMDGVMFMHSARLAALRAVLDDPRQVGALRRIVSQFSFSADPSFLRRDIRVQPELEPFGCVGDLGWYNIRWALWVMGGELPQRVRAWTWQESDLGDGKTGVPLDFSAEMVFRDGVTSSFYCSFLTHHQQWAHVSGQAGTLWIEDFVLPFFGNTQRFVAQKCEFNDTGWDFNMAVYQARHEVAEYSNAHTNAPESNQFRTFNQLVVERRLDPQWPTWALKTQVVMDACMESSRREGEWVSLNQ